MKKIWKIVIAAAVVLVVAAAVTTAVCLHFFLAPKIAETKDLGSVHDGKNLRVGILGDTQLPGSEEEEQANKGVYKANLKAALELMKEQKVDLLIHVGDFCEVASDFGYQTYLSVFNEVYSDAASRPVTQYIMGNHDFWTEGSHGYPGYKQNLFEKNLEQSPWTHLILNGFHFIAASPDSGDSSRAYTGRALNWLDEQIALAEKDAEKDGKPIFVITHQNPSATVYGSGEWGDQSLKSLLDKYPQAVSISGHSHFSILDERSIYQDKFTAFTTQSIAYLEMERDKFDAFRAYDAETNAYSTLKGYISCPPDDTHVSMCLIMNVGQEKTEIERWNVLEKCEEKADSRWTLAYPLDLAHFTYRMNDRQIGRAAPVFPQGAAIAYESEISNWNPDGAVKSLPGISFPAARHADLVHSYFLRLTNTQTGAQYEYTVYSDFYKGEKSMADTVKIAIDPSVPGGSYRVEVYAAESFGQMSKPLAGEIDYRQPAPQQQVQ